MLDCFLLPNLISVAINGRFLCRASLSESLLEDPCIEDFSEQLDNPCLLQNLLHIFCILLWIREEPTVDHSSYVCDQRPQYGKQTQGQVSTGDWETCSQEWGCSCSSSPQTCVKPLLRSALPLLSSSNCSVNPPRAAHAYFLLLS